MRINQKTKASGKQAWKKQSTRAKVSCFDNAPAESFFHTLKVEELYGQIYETRQEAKSSVFEYIEICYTLNGRN